MKTRTITFDIPADVWSKLNELGRQNGKSAQETAINAIDLYIDIQQAFSETDRITLIDEYLSDPEMRVMRIDRKSL